MSLMEISTKLHWTAYSKYAMGAGFVGFNLTKAEEKKGCYDYHTMFIHKDILDENGEYRKRWIAGGDFANEALEDQIEKDCRDLARLLEKFLIGHDYFKDPDQPGRVADGQTAVKS